MHCADAKRGVDMRRSRWLLVLLVIGLAGCASRSHATSPAQTTAIPTPPHQTTLSACPQLPTVMNDRSTATDIILSFYDAINLHDLPRAYSYLSPISPLPTPLPTTGATPTPTPPVADYATWVQGYAHTACVILTYQGAETAVTSATTGYAGIGHGLLVPISLTAINADGTLQQFAGTYAVRYDPTQGIAPTGYIALNFSQFTQVGG